MRDRKSIAVWLRGMRVWRCPMTGGQHYSNTEIIRRGMRRFGEWR